MNHTVQTIAVCAMNMFTCTCFTYLAVHFEKWWIVLFALLGYASLRAEHKAETKKQMENDEDDLDRILWQNDKGE